MPTPRRARPTRRRNWPPPWAIPWSMPQPRPRVAGRARYPADPGLTFATPAPFIRLDYLFQAPGPRLVPVAARRLGLTPDAAGFYPSDHVGLVVEFAPPD